MEPLMYVRHQIVAIAENVMAGLTIARRAHSAVIAERSALGSALQEQPFVQMGLVARIAT